jgi:hypothetical protein
MTKSKYIFEQLARSGECWHSDEDIIKPNEMGQYSRCKKCGYTFDWMLGDDDRGRPDFSNSEGFFWLWERVIEKPWYQDFIKFATYIDNTEEEIEADFLMKKMGLNNFIHPTRFFDALYDFLKGGRT